MSERKPPRPTARADRRYHHGDLRNAALLEATRIVEDEGVLALSLREVARRAGVNPMALYNHFADKEALLVAVAEQAFVLLHQHLLQAAPFSLEPVEWLRRGAAGYVRFGFAHPSLFDLMFGRSSEAYRTIESFRQAASAVFNGLLDCLTQLGQAGRLRVAPVDAAMAVWSAIHGFTLLWNHAPALVPGQRVDVEAQAATLVESVLAGLLAPPEAEPPGRPRRQAARKP